tara:strand:- start:123 stop:341 length:219 start_codon:yes stop_codon:yes gene_type:complete
MRIKTTDEVVRKVIEKIDSRSLVGQRKYGTTMQREINTNKKDLYDFINDVQEELMDALLYIESVKTIIKQEQ